VSDVGDSSAQTASSKERRNRFANVSGDPSRSNLASQTLIRVRDWYPGNWRKT